VLPEWSRHLLFASALASVVVVVSVVLAQYVLVPASHSPAVAQSPLGSLILMLFGVA
jgi:hypothetical protein